MAMMGTKWGVQSWVASTISSPKFPNQFGCTAYNPAKPAPTSTPTLTLTTTRRSRLVMGASASSFAPDISETLGDVTIFTASGEPVMFKDLWDQNEGIAVVALLRHFGCFCCWELAMTLKEYRERFEGAGAKLIAVGVGTPDKARMLADRLPFPMDCLYADPDRKAKVFSRRDAVQKAMKNYTIRATPDDASGVLQQGGMFVFKGKELLYSRKDEGTGDHAPLDDVIEVCRKVQVP
ncbi:hypothetical protein Tsubulata_007460 [Turnera subulata]|uniref:Thioredoxin domain-containing protein n=1 Tax=Turnera subulata TaxID=218843 RepID=A0A9Q0JKS9_9ROSI|nr:hypothetical protein Tsubulata_007460 [Turnera subulata]